MDELKQKRFSISACIFVALLSLFVTATPSHADQPLLKKFIIEYNRRAVEQGLNSDFYRGEEGILALTPVEARTLGMKVVIDEDYLESVRLLQDADKCLEKSKRALSSTGKDPSPGYYAREISENWLAYKKALQDAGRRLKNYHSRLNQDNDDRLNEAACIRIIDRMLDESIQNPVRGLRDKLALFYNSCRGITGKDYPLTEKNVDFVNYVFNGFLKDATQADREAFDLDLDQGYIRSGTYDWKDAAGFGTSEYCLLLEEALKRLGNTIYPVDPLLFMALMKRESSYNPMAVSSVGAAGLTQIMPETGKELGMDNIFMPDYYIEAQSLIKKEREARNNALALLQEINAENGLKIAEQARQQMQESLKLGKRKSGLFERYEEALLVNRNDDRLKAAISIEYGLKYFAGLMKRYSGDISLALAAYNAGDFRVRDYNGIPPYKETVTFRNKILEYYRVYVDEALDR
jgi:hypothetical protein